MLIEDAKNENTKKQNISKSRINIMTNIFSKKYIFIYIVTLMISMVGLTGNVSPFSISIMAACFANTIPAIGIIIAALIGNAIGFGVEGALSYLITAIVMVISFFIIKPKFIEDDKNEKISVGKNVFIATLIVQIIGCFTSGCTVYDILTSITFAIITYIFYKIFVNAIPAVENFGEKKIFTIEEVIGTSLLLAIAVSCFGDYSLWGISIRNVLSIFIVLVLGWKNGILVGTTSGVTIGVTLGVITGSEPIMIAAYAISGMIAGILNRFGKIGVIVGFALGNVVLAYVSNGYTVELIHFKEILIASIGLLLLPKNIKLDIDGFIPKQKLFPTYPTRGLNKSKDVVENLNNVSDVIKNMANSYEEPQISLESDNEQRLKNKEIFISELLNNLDSYKDNMLYLDVANTEGEIVDKIFDFMIEKQEIKREDLIKIFKDCNSYIIGLEDENLNEYLHESIMQIVRSINNAYRMCKNDFIWEKKIEEANQHAKKQLNTVSKAIKGIANNIEKDYEEDNEYSEQKEKIIFELKNANIDIEDILIKKTDRFFVEIYLLKNETKKDIDKIEKILKKVLKEEVELAEETKGVALKFISKDKYKFYISTADATKTGSEESGDSNIQIRLKDGNYLIALSDGMGSGKPAKKSSLKSLKMLESLLYSGFDKENSIKLINSMLISNNKEIFATLDIAILDLYNGKIEFIKNGACPSYIKNRNKVQVIKANSLPAGIIEDKNLTIYEKDIKHNDILLMCTDGILDSNIEYKNKELWLKYLLEDIETENTRKISDLILTEAIDNNFGRIQDDLSIIICRFENIK